MATAAKPIVPFELATQQKALDRRRQMAMAMYANAMQNNAPQAQGAQAARTNPLQYVAQALQGYMANRQMGGIDQEENVLGQQIGEQQKAAQAAAIRQEMMKLLVDKTGERATPESVRSTIFSEDPSKMEYHQPGMRPDQLNGKPYFAVTDKDGSVKPVFAPTDGTKVEVNTGAKLGQRVNEQGGTHFMYGGKGREAFDSLVGRLNTSQNILNTLDQNPQMGAGAEVFQIARKWAEALGAPVNDATTPTEMAKMQLGQMVLERLGGLGAQVSDADRKFMMETQGSLTNDPEALRRMILLEAKYTMEAVDRLRQGRDAMQEKLGSEASLPDYFFNLKLNDKNAEDMQRLFQGQDFQPRAPVQPQPAPNQPPGRLRRTQ